MIEPLLRTNPGHSRFITRLLSHSQLLQYEVSGVAIPDTRASQLPLTTHPA